MAVCCNSCRLSNNRAGSLNSQDIQLKNKSDILPLERHFHTKSIGNQKNFIKITTTKFQNKLDIKPRCHIALLQMYEIPQLQKRRLLIFKKKLLTICSFSQNLQNPPWPSLLEKLRSPFRNFAIFYADKFLLSAEVVSTLPIVLMIPQDSLLSDN